MVSLLYRHLYDHEPEKLTSSLQEVDWRMFDNSTVVFVLRGIKFSFFEYGYPLVKPTIREESLGVDIASDEDISAMKLLAIAKRGVKKDFYDLWFLMKKRGWDLKDVIGFAKFKYPNIDTGRMSTFQVHDRINDDKGG